jgi:hypothetical protein
MRFAVALGSLMADLPIAIFAQQIDSIAGQPPDDRAHAAA